MTGMVTPWLYNPNNSQFLKFHFPLQGGRFDPAAGHQLPVWEASYTTHYFNTPGTGASSFRNHNGEGGCSGNGHQPRNLKCPRPWDTPPFFKKFKNQYRDENQS